MAIIVEAMLVIIDQYGDTEFSGGKM